jgi:RecA/RadA recombinase
MATASSERPTLSELKLALAARSTRGVAPAQGELFATVPSGWSEVDTLLGGGLPRGRLSVIVGQRSSV